MAEASQSHQYMTLDEWNRSPANCPQPSQSVTEYTSIYSSPCCWEIPTELVTLEKVVGEGAFGQVAKATVIGLQGKPTKTLVAVKMLKGIKYFKYLDVLQWNSEGNTPLEKLNLRQVASKDSAFFSILKVARQAQSPPTTPLKWGE